MQQSLATPSFTANGALLIDPRVGQSPDTRGQLTQGIGSLDGLTVDSELRVLTSREVTGRAVDALELAARVEVKDEDGFSLRGLLAGLLPEAINETLTDEDQSTPPDLSEARNREALRRQFIRNLTAERAGDSYVIDISYTSTDVGFAAEAVNTLMREYLQASGRQRVEQVEHTRDWLSSRLESLEVNVRDAETAVAEFRGENELVALRGEMLPTEIALNAAIENLIRLRGAALVSEIQVQQLTEQIESGDVNAITVPVGERSNALNEFQTVYAGLLREERDMLINWAEDTPIIQSIRQRQEQIRGLILEEYRQLRDRLAQQSEALARQVTATDTVITDLRKEYNNSIRETVELRNLEREADAKRQLYERLLEEFNSTSQLLTFDATSARVIAWAVPPDRKSAPRSRQIVVLAMFGAIFLAVSLVYLREALDGSFRTYEEVGQDLGLQFIGVMPTFRSDNDFRSFWQRFSISSGSFGSIVKGQGGAGLSRAAQKLCFASLQPNSITAGTIRSIRVQLMLQKDQSGRSSPCQVVGFVSTTRGEGKTTTSFNLASVLAQQNQRVVIVDMDMVSRGMTKQIAPVAPQMGQLGEFLTNPHDALSRLAPIEPLNGLCIIGNTDQGVMSHSMLHDKKCIEDMFGILRQSFDYIILDLPPMQGVADTRLLLELADKLIFAIRWGVTPRNQVLSLFKQRLIPKRQILGVLYTRAKIKKYRLFNRTQTLEYYT